MIYLFTKEIKKIVKFLSLLDNRYKEWYLVKHFKGDIWLYRNKNYDYKTPISWSEKLLDSSQCFMLDLFQKYSYQNEPIKVKSFLRNERKLRLENGIIKGVEINE